MKKILLLFVASSFIFTSCNSSDDSPIQDVLIGKWKIVQEFENDQEIELDCTSEGILEFKSNLTYTDEGFDEDANGNCTLEESLNGFWLKNPNGSYTLTSSDGSSNTANLVFEDDNTFIFTGVDGDLIYKTVYKRQ